MIGCSVIIPVYNVENYIEECIVSILKQSYTEFELILVDDGSTDRSGYICDAFAKEDARIRVIHKKNGGVSSARNTGIDNAKYEYIMFIDSDDYIERDYLRIHMACKDEADSVISGIKFVGEQYDSYSCTLPNCFITKKTIDHYYIKLDKEYVFYAIYGKVYKRSIINEYNIRFSADYSILEDSAFVFEYLGKCERIRVLDYVGYNYRQIPEVSLRKKIHRNALDALAYRYIKSQEIRECLNKKNRHYYDQQQFTWLRIYYRQLLENKSIDNLNKKKMLKKYTMHPQLKEIIRNAPAESFLHLKYNAELLLYKSGFYYPLFIQRIR